MLTRYALSGTPSANAYTQWVEQVKALVQSLHGDNWRTHGGPMVMPWNVPPMMQPYVGQPAAMYDNETYVTLANTGKIDISAPQVASNSGKVVFVLAGPSVIAAAPKEMTAIQRAANAVFTTGDAAADELGLPSLNAIQDAIKGIGKEVLVGVGVTLAVAYLLKRKR